MTAIDTRQRHLGVLEAASHDLRQPVQALGLFVNALRAASQHGELDAQWVDEICRRMRSSLRGMGRLLDSLLDLALPDAAASGVSLRPVGLQEIFSQLTDEFQVVAEDKKLDLRIVPTALWVHANDLVLGRILGNLLGNALRYTETGKVLLGCRRRGDEVEIQVWDTGIGIPEDQRAGVFSEYFRASNAGTARESSGALGLGLAIVQRSVALIGATLDLRSELGRGSMFSIRLARCEPDDRRSVC